MENTIKKFATESAALAFWSKEWETYTNCYLVKNENGFILIDTAREENGKDQLKLFSLLNISESDIKAVIATHGHKDHIGNVNLFENASRFIHVDDISLVPENERKFYKVLEGDKGVLFDFEWLQLGKHTPGSIVLYHKSTKTLFAGDYIFFFGFPLPHDGLVSEAPEVREFWFEFVSSGEFSKASKSQNINPLDIAKDFQKLGAYDADYLCTGHGVVLKHNISSFFKKLSSEVINYESK